MKVIFFGTPDIAANILKGLICNHVDIVCVVTKPDKRQGRSQRMRAPAVKEFVLKNYPNIDVLQPEKASTSEFEQTLKKYRADLFIVVAYGEILKQNILDIPQLCCLNVHASLLPRYRGAAPIHRAIINGDTESGVSIMQMVLAMDAGDILCMLKTSITLDMDVADLSRRVEQLGVQGLLKTIEDFQKGSIKKIKQDESLVTYAPKITTEECKIDFDRPSICVHNLIRGVHPFPGAFCYIILNNEKKRLKVKKAELYPDASEASPGTVLVYDQSGFVVKTKDSAIKFLNLQLEGKSAMDASDFIKGYSKPIIV